MKKFSSKRSIQLLAHLLHEYGVNDLVVSPGSRNAPIAMHFAGIEVFNCYSVVDERSAGFVAIGMAQSIKKPVALTCTSGSASANYYPAVVEAFYQNIPLLLLTADRPSDFVDIFDGQTIRQKNLYQQHSYGDFELLEDEEENAQEQNWDIIKKALALCYEKQGPVHINIPLSEPLYNLVAEIPFFSSIEKNDVSKDYILPSHLIADWNTSKRILILVGTKTDDGELDALLAQLVKNHTSVVLCEVNSNLRHDKFFRHIDRYIYNFSDEDIKTFAPDLLITVGQNVVSKKVKQFLRKAKPAKHWHIDPVWQPDTYFALSERVEVKPELFFSQLISKVNLDPLSYYNLWDVLRAKKDQKHQEYIEKVIYSDFVFFKLFSELVPADYAIHFSNSSAIRYAQLFNFDGNKVFCNRGTSGIDGSTSTAVGFAIKNPTPTVLVTGDLSFFYDINGLWNQYIPPYFRVIVFNNGEGNIFKIIPGPENADVDVLDEFIATKHKRTAESIAKMFNFSYTKVEDEDALSRVLENFFKPSTQPKLLEVNTSSIQNGDILRGYFDYMK